MVVKNITNKLRVRKNTPAPPSKEGGRKRFIASPFADDKQVRKKIDFGLEHNEEFGTPMGSPTGMGAGSCPGGRDNPWDELEFANSPRTIGEGPTVTVPKEGKSLNAPNTGIPLRPAKNQQNTKGNLTVEGMEETTVHPKDPNAEPNEKTKGRKAAAVNPPFSGMDTKNNSERQMIPFLFEQSRECVGWEAQVKPKFSLLHRLTNSRPSKRSDEEIV